MNNLGEQLVAIATAIIGVAIVAVIVSKRSNTADVITSASNAFAGALATAVSPITGGAAGPVSGFAGSLPYPQLRNGGY